MTFLKAIVLTALLQSSPPATRGDLLELVKTGMKQAKDDGVDLGTNYGAAMTLWVQKDRVGACKVLKIADKAAGAERYSIEILDDMKAMRKYCGRGARTTK